MTITKSACTRALISVRVRTRSEHLRQLRNKTTYQTSRSKLRSHLIKLYHKCIFSGWNNPLELQMAHIIPRKIGYKIGFTDTDTESNCILLSSGLHSLFDNFQWTLDIFSFLDLPITSDDKFTSTILMKHVPNPGQSSLSHCVDRIYQIPVKYFRSFYAHYYTYLQMRYTTCIEPETFFRTCIDSQIFKDLSTLKTTTEIRNYLLNLRDTEHSHDCTIIIDHRDSRDPVSYKIIWHLWGWNNSTWEPRYCISDPLHRQYMDYIEQQSDPDWTPLS